jgi:hypothetical protein
MEKDLGKIQKNPDTDIVIRIDDFGGKTGLTIREFVRSERYTGFTKAGTRIPAEKFSEFKKIIESINEKELASASQQAAETAQAPAQKQLKSSKAEKSEKKPHKENFDNLEEQAM